MKGTQSAEKKVELRIVDVIARYEEKRNGKLTGVVIYTVRPSERTLALEPDTQEYRVVFFDGELQNCTCRGYREYGHCYHGSELAKREQPKTEQAELEEMKPYASRLHNGVTLEKYHADTKRENSEESLERRIRERESSLHNSEPLHMVHGIPMR